MRRSSVLALATLTVLVSCRTAPAPTGFAPQPPGSGQPVAQITSVNSIPTGVTFQVALNHVVGPSVNQPGDRFYATVLEPLVTNYSEVVVPQGATISGIITALNAQSGQALVRLNFDQISWRGRTRRFGADVMSVNLAPMGNTAAMKAASGAGPAVSFGTVISGADLEKLIAAGTLTNGAGTVLSLGSEAFIPVGARLVLRTSREVDLQ